MKTLILMRHAKATWDHDLWADFDRPLNPTGESDASRMGRRLARAEMLPDVMLCSSARRTTQTAELIALEVSCADRVQHKPDLYLCPVSVWEDLIHRFPEAWNCVLCIGHNNGIEDLVSHLRGQQTAMPTAGVAIVRLENWQGFDRSIQTVQVEVWRPE